MLVVTQRLPLFPGQDWLVRFINTTGKAILRPENIAIGRPDQIAIGLEDPTFIDLMCITAIFASPDIVKHVVADDCPG